MTRSILFICFSVFISVVNAQAQVDSVDTQNIEVKTDREAEYPDGDRALLMKVYQNAPYSQEAIDGHAEGNVMISFMVNTDSTLTDFVVLQDVEPKCGPAVIEIMKTLKFIPAIENSTVIRRQKIVSLMVRAH